jgi:hypothetical protein
MSKFHEIIEQIVALHDQKQKDYGRDEDPFANVRAAEDFGLPGYVGALIRMNDKMRRLQKFVEKGELANESVEDAFLDLAVYAVIGLILYQETIKPEPFEEVVSKKVAGFDLKGDDFIKFLLSRSDTTDKTEAPKNYEFKANIPRNFFWSSLLRGGDNAETCDHLNEWGEPYTNSPWFKGQPCPKCGKVL